MPESVSELSLVLLRMIQSFYITMGQEAFVSLDAFICFSKFSKINGVIVMCPPPIFQGVVILAVLGVVFGLYRTLLCFKSVEVKLIRLASLLNVVESFPQLDLVMPRIIWKGISPCTILVTAFMIIIVPIVEVITILICILGWSILTEGEKKIRYLQFKECLGWVLTFTGVLAFS